MTAIGGKCQHVGGFGKEASVIFNYYVLIGEGECLDQKGNKEVSQPPGKGAYHESEAVKKSH